MQETRKENWKIIVKYLSKYEIILQYGSMERSVVWKFCIYKYRNTTESSKLRQKCKSSNTKFFWNFVPSWTRLQGGFQLSRFSRKEDRASNFSHKKGRVGQIREVVLNMKSSYIFFILTNPFQCYLSECLVCMCLFCLFTPFPSVLIVSWEEVTTDT